MNLWTNEWKNKWMNSQILDIYDTQPKRNITHVWLLHDDDENSMNWWMNV